MARKVLTDVMWEELKITLKKHGCHSWKNDRTVMEAILFKLRTGAPWRDLPSEFCPWKTAYNRFNRWAKKGLWENFFLAYEAKLTRSGFSPMEVMSGLTSMRAELGVAKNDLSDDLAVALPLSCTLPPMRMEIRSILKSLAVKCTTVKLLQQ